MGYNEYDIVSNIDIFQYLEFGISDNQFVVNVMNKINDKEFIRFKDIVLYAISTNKLDLVSKRSYFFKCLLYDVNVDK